MTRLVELIDFFKGPETKWLFTARSGGPEWLGNQLTPVRCERLTASDSREMLIRLTGQEATLPQAAEPWAELVEWCDGNPSAIRVAVSCLAGLKPLNNAAVPTFIERAAIGECVAAEPGLLIPIAEAGRAILERLDAAGDPHVALRLRILSLFSGA